MTDDDAELKELRAPLPPLRERGPICAGIEQATKLLRAQGIEPAEIHMTRYVHDALAAELGVPKGRGVYLAELDGIRIRIV